MRVIQDNVLIRPVYETKVGSITFVHAKQSLEGEVLAVGEGKKINDVVEPLTVAVGDRVIYGPTVTKVKIKGEELIVARESDIYGILG
jgi:chaperonin GroES